MRRYSKAIATRVAKYGTGCLINRGTQPYSRCRGGKRADLGDRYFRSGWEANYARYLNCLISQGQIKKWEYEPKTFVFPGETHGAMTYTPDFLISENDGRELYHEVKGWLTSRARMAMKRMKKHYPEIKVVMIGEKEYGEIKKRVSSVIPNWE